MKLVNVQVAQRIKVVSNGAVKGHKWARIVVNGKTVHVGQLPYIRRVAIGKYNMLPNF
jgi:hypothetical protein